MNTATVERPKLRQTVASTPFRPGISEDEATEQARLLHVLADPVRILILSLLAKHGGQMHVENIVESINAFRPLAQPTVSHHIRLLRDANLIEIHRRDKLYAFYMIKPGAASRLQALKGVLTTLFQPAEAPW